MSGALNVWMNGERVGTWQVQRGVHSFTYAPAWLESPRSRALSLSLPLTAALRIHGEVVENYFDNLLPDNMDIRKRLSRRHKTRTPHAFDLLQAIGRDCIGAVQLLPPDAPAEGWDRIAGQPLSEAEIANILRNIPLGNEAAGADSASDWRISLAGAQEKTALLKLAGQWARPLGATPSTHIFKLPLGIIANHASVNMFDSVQNEWLCAQIISALGLPVANTEMATFEDQQALVVERFDRSLVQASNPANNWIARIPQEDFCQALGLPPGRKYETDGGPTAEQALKLLAGSRQAAFDRVLFQLTQLTFWLMAAPDGHAKNYSLFIEPQTRYRMTPLYDVLSVWPYVGRGKGQLHQRNVRMALSVKGASRHHHLVEIQPRHFKDMARTSGSPVAWQAMLELAQRVPQALDAVQSQLPADFPGRIGEPIAKGMRVQARKFLDQSEP